MCTTIVSLRSGPRCDPDTAALHRLGSGRGFAASRTCQRAYLSPRNRGRFTLTSSFETRTLLSQSGSSAFEPVTAYTFTSMLDRVTYSIHRRVRKQVQAGDSDAQVNNQFGDGSMRQPCPWSCMLRLSTSRTHVPTGGGGSRASKHRRHLGGAIAERDGEQLQNKASRIAVLLTSASSVQHDDDLGVVMRCCRSQRGALAQLQVRRIAPFRWPGRRGCRSNQTCHLSAATCSALPLIFGAQWRVSCSCATCKLSVTASNRQTIGTCVPATNGTSPAPFRTRTSVVGKCTMKCVCGCVLGAGKGGAVLAGAATSETVARSFMTFCRPHNSTE